MGVAGLPSKSDEGGAVFLVVTDSEVGPLGLQVFKRGPQTENVLAHGPFPSRNSRGLWGHLYGIPKPTGAPPPF